MQVPNFDLFLIWKEILILISEGYNRLRLRDIMYTIS